MKNVPAPFVALTAVVLLVLLAWFVLHGKIETEYRLPVIAVFSIAAMFAILTFLVAMFDAAKLTVNTQALGLPDGSVRALIALSLIVIFAVLTLARLSCSEDGLSDQLVTLLAEGAKDDASSPPESPTPEATPTPEASPTPSPAAGGSPAPSPSPGGFGRNASTAPTPKPTPGPSSRGSRPVDRAIEIVAARQEASQDLAKQLLTMLGTLLAAVSSFYFGSSSATSAAMRGQNPQPPGSGTVGGGQGNPQARAGGGAAAGGTASGGGASATG